MKHVIAIDIGGTKTIGAILNEDGELLESIRIPTNPKLGPENLMKSLFEIIEQLVSIRKIDCIAIGSAGRINTETGEVFFASDNIPGWTGVKIKEIVEAKFKIQTVVENDCKVTGLGEEWMGSAIGKKSYVCIALGTGIGAAVKLNGELIHGAHWSAGELGHMTLYPNGRQCNCGLKGCLEQYCSGTALVKIFNEKTTQTITTGYEFFDLVKDKNEVALSVLNDFIDDLVVAILSLSNIYDPEIIILGGGLIDTKCYWWNQMIEKVNQSPLTNLFVPQVVPATLGSKAALYGAAYLGFKKLNDVD